MNRIVTIASALLTFIGLFQLYLNLTSNEIISLETSIKIIKAAFLSNPFKMSLLSVGIFFISLLIGLLINKIIHYLNFPKRKKIAGEQTISDLKKREEIRSALTSRIVNDQIPYMQSLKEPWIRVNGDFHKIIIRDIHDDKFPYIGDWWKLETFDLKDDGIEFFDKSSVIGFDIYYNEQNQWDAIHYSDRLKAGRYSKANKPYCIDFIPYENILHIDWKKDDRESCITIFCKFKYAARALHPFKEFRYYVESHGNFLYRLEDEDRSNFKKYEWRFSRLVYLLTSKLSKLKLAFIQ